MFNDNDNGSSIMKGNIIKALRLEAEAQEARAMTNLKNYFNNPAAIGEHPDVVEECKKLIKDIAEAREMIETIKSL
jgi:hypothetical protein